MALLGLSFDIEDWHQLAGMRADGTFSEASARIDGCIERILDLCDEVGVKGTFFILGLLVVSRPHLVKRIAQRGHEIASHSSRHRLVHSMTREEFVADLRESKYLLEDLSATAVVGFRAPEFSVQRLDHPCFAALAGAGFRYDSSVFPVHRLRYGIADAPRTPFVIATAVGSLVELPLATVPIWRWRVPIAGGSYFRMLPASFITWAAKRAVGRAESLVFYFHPYEFSREFLCLPGGLMRNRPIVKHVVLHNFATWRIAASLRALLRRFDFGPLRELAAQVA